MLNTATANKVLSEQRKVSFLREFKLPQIYEYFAENNINVNFSLFCIKILKFSVNSLQVH